MKAITTLLLIVASLWSQAQPQMTANTPPALFYEVKNMEGYQKALEKARAENKMLLVVVHRGETFAQMLRSNFFTGNDMEAALSNYLPLSLRVYDEMGSRWLELFPKREKLPAFYFLNNEELLLLQEEGALLRPQFEKAALKARQIDTEYKTILKAKGERALTTAEWLTYLSIHELNFPFSKTMNVALPFFNSMSKNELLQKAIIPYLERYALDIETRYPWLMLRNVSTIKEAQSSFAPDSFFASVYSYNLDRIIFNQDSVLLQQFADSLLPLNPDKEVKLWELQQATYRRYAEETNKLHYWAEALIKYPSSEGSAAQRGEQLFNGAYTLAENYDHPQAHKAARTLALKAWQENKSFKYKLLEAYMSYLLKDHKRALFNVNEATEITNDPIQLEKALRLKKIIEEEM